VFRGINQVNFLSSISEHGHSESAADAKRKLDEWLDMSHVSLDTSE